VHQFISKALKTMCLRSPLLSPSCPTGFRLQMGTSFHSRRRSPRDRGSVSGRNHMPPFLPHLFPRGCFPAYSTFSPTVPGESLGFTHMHTCSFPFSLQVLAAPTSSPPPLFYIRFFLVSERFIFLPHPPLFRRFVLFPL